MTSNINNSLTIIDDLLTISPWTRPGVIRNITKGIIVHWVGNPNTTAKNNRDYFESLSKSHVTSASANYIIGLQGEILCMVPMEEKAYASGWPIYSDITRTHFDGKINDESISIETCHLDDVGTYTTITYTNMVKLCAYLLDKYHLSSKDHLFRHFDICGEGIAYGQQWKKKDCPRFFVNNPNEWDKFKMNVFNSQKNPYPYAPP